MAETQPYLVNVFHHVDQYTNEKNDTQTSVFLPVLRLITQVTQHLVVKQKVWVDMTKPTDEKLVKQALTGDDAAFGLLFLRHQGELYRFALSYLRNPTDAEDLTQEAFIDAYTKLRSLQEPAKFVTWLRTITKNLCISWLRRQTTTFSYEEMMQDGQFEVQMTERFGMSRRIPTPDELLVQKEMHQTILAAIDSLSEKNRLVTKLHYLDGMSYKDISQLLNVPVSTIEGRLYRARKQLKKEMTMMKEIQEQSKIESTLEEMQRQIVGLRKQLMIITQGEKDSLHQEKMVAARTICRLPVNEENPITWGIIGAYRLDHAPDNQRISLNQKGKISFWSSSVDEYLNLAPDMEIANLAKNFTNPIVITVLKRLVKGQSSVAELAKLCDVSESELDNALEPLIVAHLVVRKEDGVVETKHFGAIVFILTLVNMTALYLQHIKFKE